MSKNDGGPAFPRNGHPDKNDSPADGMTLRDYFAGQTLAYLIDAWLADGLSKDEVASDAYGYADAMLAERDR